MSSDRTFADQQDGHSGTQAQTVNLIQAIRLTGYSRRTLYYWVKVGKVRTQRTPTGRLRIVAASLPRPKADCTESHRDPTDGVSR